MKKLHLLLPLLLLSGLAHKAQTYILDTATKEAVPYATVSFGNGQGVFADEDGMFLFTKKMYTDVDSLFITSLGYKNLNIATTKLADTLFMTQEIDQLDEVVIYSVKHKTYEVETLKPYLDDDYYKCWLPTIESEIAVFFPNSNKRVKQLNQVHFPIALESQDWDKRKRKNAEKKPFSTLFKVNFYNNNNGAPGEPLLYENVVFRVTEKDGDQYDLDVSGHDIFIPKTGIFISIQVLGYTNENGKLLPNKKYKEIKGRQGLVKIPTNFRPLLPFTDEITPHRTYTKRVFLHNNAWVQFNRASAPNSSLIRQGVKNYGMGISFKLFEDE
ncbi:MAG: carboxypeptidase-like regulatory domain-containing protein [Algicola sp.]|nr:carboxypeptidase-like regulatory domain-containing protein [Algicola sp.]